MSYTLFMKSLSRTRKIGGSLLVTIPKELVVAIGLQANQLVEIEVKKPPQSFFGKVRGIGSFTKEDELSTHE